MHTVYKFKENDKWIAMAVHGDDATQIAYLESIQAEVVDITQFDFRPNVTHVAPHNTEINEAGEIVRFIAPYSYLLDGERVNVFTLVDHDATPAGVVFVDPLDDIKDQKRVEIQDEKKRVRDGGVLVDGVLFDTDMPARMSYQEFAMKLAQDPAYTVATWKASPGIFTAMDVAKFGAVIAAGEQQMQAVFAWQEAQEKNVDEALTEDEVAAVSIVYNG